MALYHKSLCFSLNINGIQEKDHKREDTASKLLDRCFHCLGFGKVSGESNEAIVRELENRAVEYDPAVLSFGRDDSPA